MREGSFFFDRYSSPGRPIDAPGAPIVTLGASSLLVISKAKNNWNSPLSGFHAESKGGNSNMAWDASAILVADPDQPGELDLRVLVDPDFPLPLAIVECAAGLDVAIGINKVKSDFPDLKCYELRFVGKCIDLSELDMRMSEWQVKHRVANKSERDLHRKRQLQRSRR